MFSIHCTENININVLLNVNYLQLTKTRSISSKTGFNKNSCFYIIFFLAFPDYFVKTRNFEC